MFSYNTEKVDYSRKQTFHKNWLVSLEGCISEALTRAVWSPIVWRGGYRAQRNFHRADWLVLDFDDPEFTLAEAIQTFCDCQHVIGTTKSHQKEKGGVTCDRFRVAVKFTEPITDLAVYRWQMEKALAKYPADESCKDGARFFYPCQEIVASLFDEDAFTQDVDKDVPEWAKPRPEVSLEKYKAMGIMPKWVQQTLMTEMPAGQRNTTVYRLGKDLYKLGLNEPRIIERIVNSATYKGTVSSELLAEITKAVRSGIRSVGIKKEE